MARKILLADDSVTAQNMGRRILTDAGYEVITVNNGSAALKKIAESKPDLIVLDVYMPGYGGLEVCQRIRDSEETARIPVLLTVGKLEPFKPEEARRVRADAYIVKPFEASELLTALSKLEDKIVPPPQPGKPGRFPKPMAAVEEPTGSRKEFGDLQTGWKNRLKIPAPQGKSREDYFEEPTGEIERFTRSEQRERQPEKTDRNVSSGIPADITADEIAALTAAAATFSPRSEEPSAKPESASEAKQATLDQAPKATEEISSDAQAGESGATFASAPEIADEPEEKTDRKTEEPAADQVSITASAQDQEKGQEQSQEKVVDGKLAQEVAAALATLAPQPGNGSAGDYADDHIAAASSRQEFSGPRWIAESVPPTADESALILETEMAKAHAALTAVEADRVAAEALSATESGVPPMESAAISAAVIEESLADAVAVQAETAQDNATAGVGEAAFAASASAGSSSDSIGAVEAISSTIPSAETPAAASEPGAPQPESELAAAWASWKQIRESVASPQVTSQIADAATAGFKDIRREAPAPPAETQPEASASTADEAVAIASIVDSVLAELKPKLMEQIAKKMKKEK